MVPPEAPQAVSRNCYVASKLLRGTFWAPLKSLKSPAAALEGLWTAKPSAAACEGVPPALPWYLPRPHKLFWNCYVARFGHPLKSFKSPAAAFEGLWDAKPSAAACEGVPPALPWYLPRPHKLFLLGLKLLRGTFWAPLKSLKSPAAAFEGLWTAKPSAAACEGVPLALPWCRSSLRRRPACFAMVPP